MYTHQNAILQFNLSITDDKQVSGELKKTLDGRLPERDHPVCIEIQMETLEVFAGGGGGGLWMRGAMDEGGYG